LRGRRRNLIVSSRDKPHNLHILFYGLRARQHGSRSVATYFRCFLPQATW